MRYAYLLGVNGNPVSSFFRIPAALALLGLASGYFHSAWRLAREQGAFEAADRAVAVATVTDLREMSSVERGFSLPLNGDAREIGHVHYLHERLGAVDDTMRIPPPVAGRVRAGLPVALEYPRDLGERPRFVGVQARPLWRVCAGVALLLGAGLLLAGRRA